MAVTLPATGSGSLTPNVHTDVVGGEHYEGVKLFDGTPGSSIPIPGSAAGLLVQALSLTQATTGTTVAVSSSVASVTLQAANAARKGWACFNNSTQVLYVIFGLTASPNLFSVKLTSGGYYELPFPFYTGVIAGIWAGVNGAAMVTELT